MTDADQGNDTVKEINGTEKENPVVDEHKPPADPSLSVKTEVDVSTEDTPNVESEETHKKIEVEVAENGDVDKVKVEDEKSEKTVEVEEVKTLIEEVKEKVVEEKISVEKVEEKTVDEVANKEEIKVEQKTDDGEKEELVTEEAKEDEKNNDSHSDPSYESDSEGESANEKNVGEDGQQSDGDEKEEEEEKALDDDEIKTNPAYIPKAGLFYMHDVRSALEETTEGAEPVVDDRKERQSRADGKWSHDLYDERKQQPKTQRELTNLYGSDGTNNKVDADRHNSNRNGDRRQRPVGRRSDDARTSQSSNRSPRYSQSNFSSVSQENRESKPNQRGTQNTRGGFQRPRTFKRTTDRPSQPTERVQNPRRSFEGRRNPNSGSDNRESGERTNVTEGEFRNIKNVQALPRRENRNQKEGNQTQKHSARDGQQQNSHYDRPHNQMRRPMNQVPSAVSIPQQHMVNPQPSHMLPGMIPPVTLVPMGVPPPSLMAPVPPPHQQYMHPRQPTDAVYFDPQAQVQGPPPPPRERRRLQFVAPTS